MAGWWVVLGGSVDGPRVRFDRPEHGNVDAPWEVTRALPKPVLPRLGNGT